jgi:predicted PurR-regulated permease PerM
MSGRAHPFTDATAYRRNVSVPVPSDSAASPPPGHRTVLHDLLVVAAVGLGIWVVHRLGRIVLVLILAMFFAYLIAPLVEIVQHSATLTGRSRRVPRGVAIAIVYLLLAGGAWSGVAILWPSAARQVDEAVARAPAYTESFHVWERGWTRYYARLRIPLELRHSIDQSMSGAGDTAVEYARGSLMALVGVLSDIPWLVLVPVLAFLMLKDAAGIRRLIVTALPHRIRLRGHRLFEDLNATLRAYVRAQIIACLLVGTLSGAGLALLGHPYAILLGVLAGVLEFIPLVGPLVVGAVAVGIAALFDPMLAIWTTVFLTIVRVVEDYVIYPRLIGRDIHLHPLGIILAVLAGAELGGVAGIFVAVPVVALAAVVVRHGLEWRSPYAERPAIADARSRSDDRPRATA